MEKTKRFIFDFQVDSEKEMTIDEMNNLFIDWIESHDLLATGLITKEDGHKIPKSFKLFGTTINVVYDNKRTDDVHAFGFCEYAQSRITLATVDGIEKLSSDRAIDCFYHEKLHMILNRMKEDELSKNEKFVDVFAKLLRQSIESEEF